MRNQTTGIELGIRPEVPLVYQITRTIDAIIIGLYSNRALFLLYNLGFGGAIAAIIGTEIPSYSSGALFGVAVIGIFIVWGPLLRQFILPFYLRLAYGKPVFGELGGLPRHTFFTALKGADALSFDFRPEDRGKVREFTKLDSEVTEECLKMAYFRNVYDWSLSDDPQDAEAAWSKVWNEQILEEVRTEGITFRDGLSEENVAFRVMLARLLGATTIAGPFIDAIQLVMILLIAMHLHGSIGLLTVIQVGVSLIFVLSIIYYLHHLYHLTEMPFFFVGLPDEIEHKYSDRLEAVRETKVRPSKIKVKKRYFSLVRNHFLRAVPLSFWNSVGALLLVAAAVVAGLLLAPAHRDSFLPWYRDFSVGLSLLPLGFVTGYLITFWILQNIKPILAPVIAAILAAFLPFAIQYLTTGQFEAGAVSSEVLAALGSAAVLVATAVSLLVTKERESD